MKITFLSILLILILNVSALAQGFLVTDINTFHASTSQPNCTSTPNPNPGDPGWRNQCDPGSGSCSGNVICGNIPASTVSTAGTCGAVPDGQGRELDLSWTGALDGGYIFHPTVNSSSNGNLDTTDYDWTWSGYFCYTNLSQIWRIEFDFYQIVTSSDILILAAQCDLSLTSCGGNGCWQFQNGWGLTSDIPCNTTTEFTANVWHQIVIHATRCTTFTHGSACPTVYKSVAVDGVTTNCTTNCNSANSQDSQAYTPVGGILENVQLDPHTTGTGSMTAYADLMTTHSGPPTTVTTPTFTPSSCSSSCNVSIACGGATCCYTTDGSKPITNGGGSCVPPTLTYSTPIPVNTSQVLNSIGTEDGVDFDSAEGSASYNFTSGVLAAPGWIFL